VFQIRTLVLGISVLLTGLASGRALHRPTSAITARIGRVMEVIDVVVDRRGSPVGGRLDVIGVTHRRCQSAGSRLARMWHEEHDEGE